MESSLRQTKLLLEVFKFNALKTLAYPWELAAFVVQRFIGLFFLLIFWTAVIEGSSSIQDLPSLPNLIAYFLISGAVCDITFAYETKFGRSVMKLIKTGELSNYLIKPMASIPYLFSTFAGQTWMSLVYSALALLAGLLIFPPPGIMNVLLFIVFIILSYIISINFNFFVAILSFYVVEANGIRNMFNHIVRVFSGALIPLTFFPNPIRDMVLLSPFPIISFTPVYVLQNVLGAEELIYLFTVSLSWAVGLSIIMIFSWKRALKLYEGIGI